MHVCVVEVASMSINICDREPWFYAKKIYGVWSSLFHDDL